MSVAGSVAQLAVGLWLLITALAQHGGLRKLIVARDVWGLVPSWTFFAPNPGVRDYHLVLREKLEDGSLTGWRNVPIFQARPSLALLWNPQKRAKKVLNDLYQSLQYFATSSEVEAQNLQYSLPYLVLIHYAAAKVPPSEGAQHFQIAIVLSSGHDDRDLEGGFLSGFHER